MARIAWKTPLFRSDWWMFALFLLGAGIACAGLGGAMRRDERAAVRSRAEHVARSMAEDLARMAVTPGSDFAGTLPGLAEAAGPEVRLAVVDSPGDPDFQQVSLARYLGHSDAKRAGTELDAGRADDRRLFALVQRAHRPGRGSEPMLFWGDGKVNAVVLGPAGSGAAAVVENFAPPAPSPRPTTMALVAFAMLVLCAAGLNDVMPGAGPVLNGILLGVGISVLSLLGRALQPSLWRGVPTDLLVRRAESLRLAELARTLAQDLPAPVSRVETIGVPIAAIGLAFYVMALAGLWHRMGRAVVRDLGAWRFAGPAALVGLLIVGVPLCSGVVLAFLRATPAEVAWVGTANFAVLTGEGSLESPLGLWQPLVWTVVVIALSTETQLLFARVVVSLLRRVPLAARATWRTILLVPWAIPLLAAVLAFHATVEPLLARLGNGRSLSAVLVALLASVWVGLPVATMLIERAWRAVPAELEDAATLEGISRRQRRKLFAPLLRPGVRAARWMAVVLSLAVSTVAQSFLPGSDGDGDLLATRSLRWAVERFEYGQAAAFALPALVVALLATFFFAGRAKAVVE